MLKSITTLFILGCVVLVGVVSAQADFIETPSFQSFDQGFLIAPQPVAGLGPVFMPVYEPEFLVTPSLMADPVPVFVPMTDQELHESVNFTQGFYFQSLAEFLKLPCANETPFESYFGINHEFVGEE